MYIYIYQNPGLTRRRRKGAGVFLSRGFSVAPEGKSNMDPRYTGEILKHLEKQNELLKNAYNSMSHELHKLQVFFFFFFLILKVKAVSCWSNFPLAHCFFGVLMKEGSNNVSDGGQIGQSTASLPNTVDVSDGGIDRHSSAIVPFTTSDEQQ
ncbi:hypothetical protein SADUNF_Sadunf09G0002100 [Salix dunnii]|uniref:Uncharacterized protein n=1 Tax=Salix dunnii TaxID=1413687 RepID=A0A835JVT5_9ROSI|nr:hypothetical protein SADUNF_Sadunf09G0002100 [Salix dunnii]